MTFGLLAGCSDVTAPPTVISQTVPLIGGQPDTATRGVVGVIVESSSGCTGSLIAPNLVLTARHCVASISNSNGTVQCGVTTFGQPFAASEFIVTPDDNIRNGVPAGSQYSAAQVVTTPGNGVCGNDLALLILTSNVSNATATAIVPRVDTPVSGTETFDAVGYGITNPNDLQGATYGERLRVNDLDVLCTEGGCTQLGGTRSEWGAITPVCSGDSGGPALDSAGRVIGVASRGDSDCQSALYSSVSAWRSLIVDTAIDAATRGGYSPPGWTGATTTDGGTPDSGTPDSGTPDSGTPDSGTPDSGTPDSGTPDSGTSDGGDPEPDSGTPEPDAGGTVGEPCTDFCAGGLACYLPENRTRGICVPHCSATDTTCPFRYECSARLGICIPGVPDTEEDDDDDSGGDSGGCGCRAAPRPDGRGALGLAFLTLAGVVLRRRRSIA
jgi:MYXO-CTERM domain-containing protein